MIGLTDRQYLIALAEIFHFPEFLGIKSCLCQCPELGAIYMAVSAEGFRHISAVSGEKMDLAHLAVCGS
jgi:hypothetical protein